MKLLNNKKLAMIMVVVIIASIFIFHYKSIENRVSNQNISDSYYPELDSFSMYEVETANQDENLQLFKSSNTLLFTLYKTCILSNICEYSNIFKWKYTAVINVILIYNYSVFVVIFSNKKDGKKRMNFVFS